MQWFKKATLVGLVGLIAWGVLTRSQAEPIVGPEASAQLVAVAEVKRANLSRTLSFSAEMRAWQEVDVHAKVSGYLKAIDVDIGDQIKQGQVLATLDVPEQKQDRAKAEADYNVAKLDYDRIKAVIKKQPGLLAEEEVDKARGTYEQAKATYERTRILADYASIEAPFNGVITKRFADPGALVQAGTASDTQTLPLVHVAEIDKLRIDFPVPESVVMQVKVGMPVMVTVQANGETMSSQIARLSDKVDSATRTMKAEIDINNKDLRLKPGMYASVSLVLETAQNALAAPVQAVVTGDKPNVWVVNAQNIVEEHPVTLGIQMPDKIEITNGVAEGDRLIYGNRNNVNAGMTVVPQLISAKGD